MIIGDHGRTMAWKYVESVFDSTEKELDENGKNSLLKEINLTINDSEMKITKQIDLRKGFLDGSPSLFQYLLSVYPADFYPKISDTCL